MRLHEATMVWRWRNQALAKFGLFWFLVGICLPHCHAQMSYKGGFVPKRESTPKIPSQPPAPQRTAPAPAPSLSSYFPDNDVTYPTFTPAGGSRPALPLAGLMFYGIPPADLPWNRDEFQGYNEPLLMPRDSVVRQPKKYFLSLTPLSPASAAEPVENAGLIAHLPEHALVWVEGTRTRSMGRTRYFLSPPLLPGRKYNYRVSTAWIEDGRWVSQTRLVPIQAGAIQAIYLRPIPVNPAKAAMRSIPE